MPVIIDGTNGVSTPNTFAFKNRIIDGGFTINQRGYTSGTSLSSGSYGHDRWKGGASGGTYTFTQGSTGVNTTITITAGSIIQVIEGANLPEGGTYVLSWTGTAQGKIGSGSFGASGITGTITAGTNTNIEFNTGTCGNVQLEVGSTATSFDYRPYGTEFDLCRRYYEQFNYTNAGGANQYITSGVGMAWTGTDVRITLSYYPKRASATCAFSGTIRFATNALGQNFTSMTFDNAGVNTVLLFNGSASGFTAGQAQQVTAQAANTLISVNAEL